MHAFLVVPMMYNMITWQFDLLLLQQVIEILSHLVTLKVKRNSSCRLLEVGFKLEHTNGLDFEAQLHSAIHSIFDHVEGTLVSRLITAPTETPRFFASAFTIQGPL
jgi:hypothetical protein